MTAYEAVVILGLEYWPPLEPRHKRRDMAWYHLAVLAAAAFVLGVSCWQVIAS